EAPSGSWRRTRRSEAPSEGTSSSALSFTILSTVPVAGSGSPVAAASRLSFARSSSAFRSASNMLPMGATSSLRPVGEEREPDERLPAGLRGHRLLASRRPCRPLDLADGVDGGAGPDLRVVAREAEEQRAVAREVHEPRYPFRIPVDDRERARAE